MENPYRPPERDSVLPSPSEFQWARVLVWSLLIFLAPNVIGLLSGLSMANWEIYGPTIKQALANARLVRQIVIPVVATLLYWRFAAGVTSRVLRHVLAVFALSQILDHSVSLLAFAVPVHELIDLRAVGRGVLAAMIGFGIAWLGARARANARPLQP